MKKYERSKKSDENHFLKKFVLENVPHIDEIFVAVMIIKKYERFKRSDENHFLRL